MPKLQKKQLKGTISIHKEDKHAFITKSKMAST